MTFADRLMPALRCLDPETAHSLALMALSMGLAPPVATAPRLILKTRVWGMEFTNPIGLAAGFDKDARVPQAVLGLGFGFTEVGSVTPRPQPGNPKPRLFRLSEDRAVINRMGFNNGGHDAMAARLSKFRAGPGGQGIAGVNLGRNKDSTDEIKDYVLGVERLGALASYLVVNVSSPNTPGLRTLQDRGPLTALLTAVKAARDGLANRPPLLVKIAPDLASADLEDIAAVAADVGIDGIIATNTTISRPAGLRDSQKGQIGGLSGAPLKSMAKGVISDLYQLVGRDIPLIGVGGIATGADAYARIRAGASLVQIYSALVFEGPYLAARIANELADLLDRDGFKSVAAAIGADHR
ncbi:MAG TPA: dihydroorotate dehydrogenase (quinone) [Rhodospirillaceae bacterium]|nr:dihydroorotate dehydrogenase (quinone) [Magnetovibrio sp.]HCS71292.1 dihydroorotate dehydrogenase (quinone) [Rhodospirillaceae bacterium]|tara:strand:- start:1370 stop:2431 length:1062 start_codon:yes stop_codon:yes gene_type:complete